MKKHPTYPSKIMLVGEYGVVVGGSALTIPFHKFQAKIRPVSDLPPGKEKDAEQSLQYIKLLYNYIEKLPIASFHAPPDIDLFPRISSPTGWIWTSRLDLVWEVREQ